MAEKHIPVPHSSPQIPFAGYRHKIEPGSPWWKTGDWSTARPHYRI